MPLCPCCYIETVPRLFCILLRTTFEQLGLEKFQIEDSRHYFTLLCITALIDLYLLELCNYHSAFDTLLLYYTSHMYFYTIFHIPALFRSNLTRHDMMTQRKAGVFAIQIRADVHNFRNSRHILGGWENILKVPMQVIVRWRYVRDRQSASSPMSTTFERVS